MAAYGTNRFTNIVFAEDEDGSPWEPLSVEAGFPEGSNVATVFVHSDMINTQGMHSPVENA